MKSRAGQVIKNFRRQDGVSLKKKDTIFLGEKRRMKNTKRVNADGDDDNNRLKRDLNIDIDKDKGKTPNIKDETNSAEIEITDPSRTLEDLAVNSARIIYHIKTIFPFVLFTDEVIADEEKLSVVIGRFFNSGYIRSVMLKDIANVSIDTSILFAKLTVIDRNFIQDPLVIKYLKKHEALKMRRILMGLIIANNNKVDLRDYSIEQIREYSEDIGRARDDESVASI